jgi:hypothetical protein
MIIQRSTSRMLAGSAQQGGARSSGAAAAALVRSAARPARISPRAAANQQQQQQQEDRQQQQQQRHLRDLGPEPALELAWSAAQNRSLFAAQCFVEAVLLAYQRGMACDDLEVRFVWRWRLASSSNLQVTYSKLHWLGSKARLTHPNHSAVSPIPPRNLETPQLALQLRELEAPQGAPQALKAQEVDLIVTWTLVIMLTAQELGLPFTPRPTDDAPAAAAGGSDPSDEQQPSDASGVTRRHGPQSLGLQGYVRSTLARYDAEGHNLSRITFLQSVTRDQGPGGGFSQAAEVMQQYTRLVLLTLEAVAAAGHPINRPLQEPVVVTTPTGYAAALMGDAAGDATPRALAVHLLAAFIGAVLGSPYSQQQFVAAAGDAYDLGFAAGELLEQLRDEEFLQVGGLLPVAAQEPGAARGITRTLFARWAGVVWTVGFLGGAFGLHFHDAESSESLHT